jgi:hypothetical protein
MRKYVFIIIVYCFAVNACKNHNKHLSTSPTSIVKEHVADNVPFPIKKVAAINKIALPFGFTLRIGRQNDFKDFKTYSLLEIWHKGLKICTDTSEEWELADKLYPMINRLNDDKYEILVEYNDRPSKDEVCVFKIANDKIVDHYSIPTFDSGAEKINGQPVYSGAWSYGEEWDENGTRYSSFEPEIYYRFTPQGIQLDSVLTRKRTREEFGNVDPFDTVYEIGFPIDTKGKIDTISKHILRKKIGE